MAQDKYALEACGMSLYLFPGNIIICNLGPESVKMDYIPKVEDCNYRSEIFHSEKPINLVNIQHMFLTMAEKYYSTWVGQLICGNFNSRITLSPNPEVFYTFSVF